MNAPVRFAMVAVFVGLSATEAAGDGAEGDRLSKDCGVNSLYLLLKLNGASIDLAELRATLPDAPTNGLSMTELQAASGQHGVALSGKRIGPGDVPIDRPMITLLRSAGNYGHFVVLEPVGTLGKSVMVLDFPRPVQALAYADLMKSGGWTGLSLAPVIYSERIGRWVAWVAGLSLVACGLAYPALRRLVTRKQTSC